MKIVHQLVDRVFRSLGYVIMPRWRLEAYLSS